MAEPFPPIDLAPRDILLYETPPVSVTDVLESFTSFRLLFACLQPTRFRRMNQNALLVIKSRVEKGNSIYIITWGNRHLTTGKQARYIDCQLGPAMLKNQPVDPIRGTERAPQLEWDGSMALFILPIPLDIERCKQQVTISGQIA